MRRREFITVLGGATAAWPLVAGAQQPERVRRIGILLATTADDAEFQAWVGAFLQALALLGSLPMPSKFADTQRNWPRSRLTSSWPMAPRP